MKKLVFCFIISASLVLFGCSRDATKLDVYNDMSSVDSGNIEGYSGSDLYTGYDSNLNQESSLKTEIRVPLEVLNFGTVEIPSPAYTIEDKAPEGTQKVEIIWSGEKSGAYFLKKFKQGNPTFTTSFRLDYGNIGYGNNKYIINFYLSGGLIQTGSFGINTFYQTIDLGDNIIYFDENALVSDENEKERMYLKYIQTTEGLIEGLPFVINNDEQDAKNIKNNHYTSPILGNIYINAYKESGYETNNTLINNNGQYIISSGRLIYNRKAKYLLEVKNIKEPKQFGDSYLTDLYEFNGKLIMKGFEFLSTGPGGGGVIPFNYDKDSGDLMVSYGDGDVCSSVYYKKIYNTISQKPILYILYSNYSVLNLEYLDQKLDLDLDLKMHNDENKDDSKSEFGGLNFKYYQKEDGVFVLKNDGYVFKDNRSIPNSDCGPIIDLNYNLDYENKELFVEVLNNKFYWDLNDLSKPNNQK